MYSQFTDFGFSPRSLWVILALISSETGSEVGHNLISLLIARDQDGVELISQRIYFVCREAATSIHKLSYAKQTVQHTFKQHTKKQQMYPCMQFVWLCGSRKKENLSKKKKRKEKKIFLWPRYWLHRCTDIQPQQKALKKTCENLKPVHLLAQWWGGLKNEG